MTTTEQTTPLDLAQFDGHTSGDWKAVPTGPVMHGYKQSWGVVVSEKNTLIAGCFHDIDGGDKTAEANARLSAAAPALLAEVKRLREALQEIAATQTLGRDVMWCVDTARAALKGRCQVSIDINAPVPVKCRQLAKEYADFRQLRRDFKRAGFEQSYRMVVAVLRGIREQWAFYKKHILA